MTQVSERTQVIVALVRSQTCLKSSYELVVHAQALLPRSSLQEQVYFSGWPASAAPPAASKPGALSHKTLTQVCKNAQIK